MRADAKRVSYVGAQERVAQAPLDCCARTRPKLRTSIDRDPANRPDEKQWTGCIAGALTEDEFRAALADAGLVDIEVRPTHRVHEHATAAIVRARKPA